MTSAGPVISPADRLGLTIFLAASTHAVLILGLAFQPQDPAKLEPPASLEVTLVQDRSDSTPEKADYLAQTAQAGGGDSDQRARPGAPFTSTELTRHTGIAPQPIRGGKREKTAESKKSVITQLYSDDKTPMHENKTPNKQTHPDRQEPLDFDLEIARLTAELKQERETYAKRPRKMVLTANTHAYVPAQYMYRWVEKVERVGNLNYPEQARRNRLEGVLMLEVELRWDGSVVETNILQSSGHAVLDESARRIVELASPYPAFPPELKDIADHLEIIRSWQFSKGSLHTGETVN